MSALLVLIVSGEIALALLARADLRDLHRLGARRAAYRISMATIMVVALSPLIYLLVPAFPLWLHLALWVPMAFASLYPARIVRLTGGPLDPEAGDSGRD